MFLENFFLCISTFLLMNFIWEKDFYSPSENILVISFGNKCFGLSFKNF